MRGGGLHGVGGLEETLVGFARSWILRHYLKSLVLWFEGGAIIQKL